MGFSADGKLLYGMRAEGNRVLLYSLNVATGAEKIVGDVGHENGPRSNLSPAMRLSLSPDGKSMVYGIAMFKSNMWMLEGFAAKRGFLERLGLR